MEQMQSVGEKVRIQRVIRGYNQEYMAYMLNISQAAYSNLERGGTEMTITRIFDIAEIFEMSPFELMPKPRFGSGLNYHAILSLLKYFGISRQVTGRSRKISAPAL